MGKWCGTNDKRVDSTAVTIFTAAGLPLFVVKGFHGHARRLRWLDARTANLAAEQPAGEQRKVTHRLGGNSQTVLSRQQNVLWITLR